MGERLSSPSESDKCLWCFSSGKSCAAILVTKQTESEVSMHQCLTVDPQLIFLKFRWIKTISADIRISCIYVEIDKIRLIYH